MSRVIEVGEPCRGNAGRWGRTVTYEVDGLPLVDWEQLPAPPLYVARIPFPDGRERHVLVRLESINDGLGFEYHDPVSDQVVGSVGRNRLAEFVQPLEEFINKQGDHTW